MRAAAAAITITLLVSVCRTTVSETHKSPGDAMHEQSQVAKAAQVTKTTKAAKTADRRQAHALPKLVDRLKRLAHCEAEAEPLQ